ncbi:MAG TPA: acyltransferase [Candidatus Omnitrophota bacterium]|nr:acyltransferase [Candidatus Omnitrophota bacterium]HPS36818.1 acyltransferase [Candidatus Omnitrophota bacterium]
MNNYFIHPKADVQTNDIGNGTRIWQFSVILPGVKIGSNCNICAHSFIEPNVTIGNNVSVHIGASVSSSVILEDNVYVGPGVRFTNDRHPRKGQPWEPMGSLVKMGASIGSNSVILPGITIGCNALIGAGSIVTKDVKDYSLVFGNRAKFKHWICCCTKRLIFNSKASAFCACGRQYLLTSKNTVEEVILPMP